MKAWLGRMSSQPSMLICFSLLHVNSQRLCERILCVVFACSSLQCLPGAPRELWELGSRHVYACMYVRMYTRTCTALYRLDVVSLCTLLTAVFTVSLELQGGNCSDQLTLICRHSDVPTDPSWIHNGTAESSQLLNTAFPGTMYTVQTNTEHRVTISGVGNVQALDGYIIQCVYSIRSNLVKSNAIKYSFIPPGQCM